MKILGEGLAFWGEQGVLRDAHQPYSESYAEYFHHRRWRTAARIISFISATVMLTSALCYTNPKNTTAVRESTKIVQATKVASTPAMLDEMPDGYGTTTIEAMRMAEPDATALVPQDPFATSGLPDAFSQDSAKTNSILDLEDANGRYIAINVNGQLIAVLATRDDVIWVQKQIFEEHNQPAAGGTITGFKFVERVEFVYLDTKTELTTKEEALNSLRGHVNVFVHEKVFVKSNVEYSTKYIADKTLPKNTKKTIKAGKNGTREEAYEIISIGGVKKEENLLGTRMLEMPVEEVIAVGTSSEEFTKENNSETQNNFVQITEDDIPDEFIDEGVTLILVDEGDIPTEEIYSQKALSSNSDKTSQNSSTQSRQVDKSSWPSSSFSAFNYPSPTKTWFSDAKMGAGENYPGIDKIRGNIDADEGIKGPETNLKFQWPMTSKYISSYFGWRGGRMHYGIDFPAPKGTPIFASESGTVTWYTLATGVGRNGYGYVVEINHGGGFSTIYAHCDSISVKVGDHVNKGDTIASTGDTPSISSVHLHFEVRCDGIPYNPLLGYLK